MMTMIYQEQRSISANADKVYDIIADLDRYAEWNPWITSARGSTEAGASVVVTANLYGRRAVFNHRMVAAERPTLFHWCDVGWFTLFVDGERKRTIEQIDDRHCRYTCELKVSGIGTPLAKLFFGKFMSEGLKAEANALKSRAEECKIGNTNPPTAQGDKP